MDILLNPKKFRSACPDPVSRDILAKTVGFFEAKGLVRIKYDDHERLWYGDFLDFVKREKVFATFLTPKGYGEGETRWDTFRNSEMSEILGFYGLAYWYTWQVTILGLGPIWMGSNETVKKKTAEHLRNGGIFAFGLSEKEHGADIYASDMMLEPKGGGNYVANGDKYYIGNANKSAYTSCFGKMAGGGPKDYVFFVAESNHPKYQLLKNVCNSQNYVAEFMLKDYPITEGEILSKGEDAWNSSLNTVNVGKFNLGWASIGICTHAFYEALNHAAHRRLFDHYVTDFVHIKQLFTDAYTRLVAMKLFALRAADYMRAASPEDRRYLLYNPMVKMKVTTEGERVIDHLWDVIAARGFEKDLFFEMAARDIRALPKLEGTVHVNMALIIKFMANYFFKPKKYAPVAKQDHTGNDDFLFKQGATKGLSKIQFHDYRPIYSKCDLPNVRAFRQQIRLLKGLLVVAKPTKEQGEDIDFLLILGELFTLVVYGQLILENAKIYSVPDDLIDQIFDVMVRDFSKFALQLYSKSSSTKAQAAMCLGMIRKPVQNRARAERVLKDHVYSLTDVYQMDPGTTEPMPNAAQ